jgi:hypothetical protein
MIRSPDLTRCTGYRVDTAEGTIGTVAVVLQRSQRAEPAVVVKQSGLGGCGVMLLPIGQVRAVDHERRRLIVRDEALTSRRVAPSGVHARTLNGA